MIVPHEKDLIVYVGTDFEQAFQFKDKDTQAVIPMTDWTGKCQIRAKQEQDATLIEEFTVTITEPLSGIVTISMTDTETAAITAKRGYYTLLLKDDTGKGWPYAMGEIAFVNTSTVADA